MRFRGRRRKAPDPPVLEDGTDALSKQPVLDPDQPVSSTSEDRLGRASFANHLARQLELAPGTGFVVALAGPWGSGKTSVLQMVEDRLEEGQATDLPTRIVVPFNPWLVSGSEQLVSQFVGELATALPRALGQSRGTKAAKHLRKYAAGLQTLERAPGLGWAFQVGGALLKGAGDRIDNSPGTLFEERERARSALRDLNVQVIVLIDDVDRLQASEIRELMRMIKLVGDFPNVTYLLAFDREVVRKALDAGDANGSEYLEKIVQIEYRLPEPPPEMLEALLVEGIDRAIQQLPDHRLDRARWEGVYMEIVRPLISRPRHVRRFVNALPLAIDLAGEEIDTVDVIALTALQTRLPRFHDDLLSLRDDLTPTVRDMVLWTSLEERKEAAAARLNGAAEDSGAPEVAYAVYKRLFPTSTEALGGHHNEADMAWGAKRRIADREVFDTYFTATLPEGALSVAEVRRAVDAFTSGPDDLDAVLAAHSTERLPALLARIWGHIDEVELDDIRSCLEVVDGHVDRLPDSSPSVWTPADQGRSFLRDLVGRFPKGEQRDAAVRHKFEISRSLTSKFIWLRTIGAWESGVDDFCEPELTEALRRELAEEVLSSDVDSLVAEAKPSWLIPTAEEDGGDDASARIAALLEDGRLLPAYLGGFQALTPGSIDYELQFDKLEKRQDRTHLIAALKQVDATSLNDEERRRVLQLAEHYRDEIRDEVDDRNPAA